MGIHIETGDNRTIDLTEGNYMYVWTWLQRQRRRGLSWKQVGDMADKDPDFLKRKAAEDGWPEDMSNEIFRDIINEQKRIEENQNSGFICNSKDKLNNFLPSEFDGSSWKTYKETLENNGFDPETVQTIENSTARILSHLSIDTTGMDRENVVKGLVIGNVQSGKTANMEALMSMTADYGWNMYIILSGTIENLRKQTQQRFRDDLYRNKCDIIWNEIDRPRPGAAVMPQYMYLNKNIRYFTVCLKNSVRLDNLIKWLHSDRNQMKNMRILVIDDECDQAGINTANIDADEKTRVYKCITNLVNQRNADGEDSDPKFGSMNYIGYTATPYANMLNDPRCESLYPKNFISTLSVSEQYFGPQQIFGNDELGYKGLSIVNKITEDDVSEIAEIHEGKTDDLPESLKEAVLWFICCTGVMRFKGSKKPLSMLVHTSQRTNHHEELAHAIQKWLRKSSVDEITDACRNTWKKQTSAFDFSKLKAQYPKYKDDEKTMREYPLFSEIEPLIREMLEVNANKYTHIELDDEQERKGFSRAIHICVDNCKKNRTVENSGDGSHYHLRLAYPTKEDNLDFAASFIVIGGATLSRGLTIEGLVSSYFLRSVHNADSLMQMGRWFGYRKGYELLPRLWLTDDTVKQFRYLSSMDNELRGTIREMEDAGKTPYDYRIKIRLPEEKGLLDLVSSNRMQAVRDERDYSGTYKQTYKFDNDENIMEKNIRSFEDFLDRLGQPDSSDRNRFSRSSVIWRGVDVDTVLGFLNGYEFSSALPECRNVVRWINTDAVKNVLDTWNVVLAGNITSDEVLGTYAHNGYEVNKVNRSKLTASAEKDVKIINIGTLRNPKDLLADIDLTRNPELEETVEHADSAKVKTIRRKSFYRETPQLLIYVISAASKSQRDEENRTDLNTSHDLIGLSINIPEQSVPTVDKDSKGYVEIDYARFGIQRAVDIQGAD